MTEKKKITAAAQVKSIKTPGTYSTDQKRLYLLVRGTSKSWLFRYTFDGKARNMSIGTYPEVTLQQARADAGAASALLAQGIDPKAQRDQEQQRRREMPTFGECAQEFITQNKPAWSNPKHVTQWTNTLATYANPVIGDTLVSEVTQADVLQILSPIWNEKTETAKRVQGRMERIFSYAAAKGWRPLGDNPAQWQGRLNAILPQPTKVKTKRNQPAMPYARLPAFWQELEGLHSTSADALRLLILTAARTNEVLGATWAEIDMDSATWTIPAERMKAGREHRVPLSKQALLVLKHRKTVSDQVAHLEGNPYVFPGAKPGKPLSNMAILLVMRRMGYGSAGAVHDHRGDYVPHGFRSTFRDWSEEQTSTPHAVSEAALAHAISNAVEAAYRRGDLLEKRKALMATWADFVTDQKVVHLKAVGR